MFFVFVFYHKSVHSQVTLTPSTFVQVLFLVAEMRENGLSITPAAFETALKVRYELVEIYSFHFVLRRCCEGASHVPNT